MTSRDRMKTVLSGNIPDKVPFSPTIYIDYACVLCGKNFEDALINPSLGAECMLGAALKYNTDVVRFVMGPDESWYSDKTVKKEDGILIQYDKKTGTKEGYYDFVGGGYYFPFEKQRFVQCINEVRDIKVISSKEYIERGYLKDIKRYIEKAHDNGLFVVGMCGGQTINFMVEKLGSVDTALMSFYDSPDLVYELINKAVEISIQKGKAFIEVGVDCIYIGDSFASSSVISPDIYKRFCAPAYKEVTQEFHNSGVFCYMHCCGNYNPLLEFLPSIGIDAMDGIDPTSGMSVKRTKDAIGKELTLMGGISCLTLLNGSSEEVYDEARKCIEEGKSGGRYVLGSACAVPRATPTKNIIAAQKAIFEYGWY
ncbi:MAG: uroporphyrinogen decarboxylase family protein [bacterium]|nr:uroporphyrinogen decarboxylase family protein [bacterium]